MPPTRPDYYQDKRWCLRCRAYVAYLSSPGGAFCAFCDSGVHLFSPDDRRAFRQGLSVEGSLARRFELGESVGDEPRFVSQRGSRL